MIKGMFKLGGDLVEVIVRGNELLFYDISSGMMTPVDGLRVDRAGVLKEHPDLENDDDWKRKAIERLKEHIKSFKTEDEKLNYVKEELKKYGYEPKTKQRPGWRPLQFN